MPVPGRAMGVCACSASPTWFQTYKKPDIPWPTSFLTPAVRGEIKLRPSTMSVNTAISAYDKAGSPKSSWQSSEVRHIFFQAGQWQRALRLSKSQVLVADGWVWVIPTGHSHTGMKHSSMN